MPRFCNFRIPTHTQKVSEEVHENWQTVLMQLCAFLSQWKTNKEKENISPQIHTFTRMDINCSELWVLWFHAAPILATPPHSCNVTLKTQQFSQMHPWCRMEFQSFHSHLSSHVAIQAHLPNDTFCAFYKQVQKLQMPCTTVSHTTHPPQGQLNMHFFHKRKG